jgi:glycosyltransferase involved in cell wall biosynthesis
MLTRSNYHRPRVSIGMPVYNGERFLREALDSVLAQTFEDFELIISDNASTDRTQEICQAYAAQDRRIRYYRNEENLGAAWNYNRVFELSTGEYFKWAAHDDLCAPEHLERCVEVLDRYPAVVLCYPKTTIIDEHGQQVENDSDGLNLRSPKPHERYAHFHNRFRFGAKCNAILGLIRTSTLGMTPLIGSYVSSDRILLGELALRGEFYEIPEHLFFRRDHPQTSVRANPRSKERVTWFDPSRRGKLQLPGWRWFFEYLSSIRRVQISWYEKTHCYAQLGRWALWNWEKLSNDLIVAAKHVLRPLPGPIKRPIRSILHHSWKLVTAISDKLRANCSIFR